MENANWLQGQLINPTIYTVKSAEAAFLVVCDPSVNEL